MSTKKALKSIKTQIEGKNHEAALYEATQLIKTLDKADTDAAQVLCYRGLALTHLGRSEEAEKCYIHAYRLQPNHPLAVQALKRMYEKNDQWDKLGRFLEVQVQEAYNQSEAEKCASALQELLQLRQSRGSEDGLYMALRLLLPSSPLLPLLQPLPPPAGSYVPFQQPSYPPESSTNIPALPSPLPHAQHLLGSLPLLLQLLIRQEALIAIRIEADVKAARMKLGAKSEKETRRDVEGQVLGGELGMDCVDLLREVAGHPGVEEDVRRSVEVKEFEFWRKLVGVLPSEIPLAPITAESQAAPSSKVSRGKKNGVSTKPVPESSPSGSSVTAFLPTPLFERKGSQSSTKAEALRRTNALADGFILLKLSGGAEPAYQWHLDSLDQSDIYYPLDLLHQYASLFPDKDLTGFIDDYCRWFRLPLPEPDEDTAQAADDKGLIGDQADGQGSQKKEKRAKRWGRKKVVNAKERRRQRRLAGKEGTLAEDVEGEEREELVASMTKLVDKLPKSIFAYRVMSRVSIQEEDWTNAVSYSEKARALVKELEIERSITLFQVRASVDASLAISLVPYYPPKHHVRSARLLNTVLSSDPSNTEARFARAQIFQYAENWSEARKMFQLVIDASIPTEGLYVADEKRRRVATREEVGWCLVNEGSLEGGREILEEIVQERDTIWEAGGSKDGEDAFVRARAWWRLGRTEWLIGDEEAKTNAEEWFSASLRALPTFAPAFTSLGQLYESASPPDSDRALKCFQKAFELDATEAEAAEKLARGYADEEEWALVRAIAVRVMEGEGGVEGVAGGEKMSGKARFAIKNAWAWKALGATEMFYRNFVKAAQAFQIVLRATPDDVSTHLLLSDAYVKSGKHVAALKTLDKVLELEPGNWVARYDVGDIQYQLGNFPAAISAFQNLVSEREELGVLAGLAQARLAQGRAMVNGGFRERARTNFLGTLLVAEKVLRADAKWRAWAWKIVADTAFELGGVATAEIAEGSEVDTTLKRLLELLAEDDDNKRSTVEGLGHPSAVLSTSSSTNIAGNSALRMAVFAFSYRAYLVRDERATVVLAAQYDLASSLHALALTAEGERREKLFQAAITAIRKALEKDAGDERLWNALGVICIDGGKQVAQHAFVLSLELYQKDPITWTNLGYLYLQLDDRELANSCFLKAQIIDPDYARAWLGQGMLAERNNDREHARGLLTHAVTLSAGALLEADLAAAAIIFERYLAPYWTDYSDLHQPAFALKHYIHQRPHDSVASNLYGLIAERLGLVDEAVKAFESTVKLLEDEFETTESHEVEVRYSIALANLARTRLAAGQYAESLEAGTNCWELISGSQDPLVARLRVQVRLSQALAKIWSGDIDGSLESFQDAMNEAEGSGIAGMKDEVAVLLARTLWGMDETEGRELAKTHLMECLSGDSPPLKVVSTLGAIALSTNDDDLLEAVLSELSSMSPENRFGDRADPAGLVLATQSLLTGNLDESISVVEASLHADPWNSKIRARLARLYLTAGRAEEGVDVLRADMRDTEPDLVALRGLARSMLGDQGGMSEIQRAIRARPWDETLPRMLLS